MVTREYRATQLSRGEDRSTKLKTVERGEKGRSATNEIDTCIYRTLLWQSPKGIAIAYQIRI